jgi:tetratricopeptide (TPR) repeat protein
MLYLCKQNNTLLTCISRYQHVEPTNIVIKGYLAILHYMQMERSFLENETQLDTSSLDAQTNYNLATRFLKFCVEKFPDNALFNHHLGKLYILSGKINECNELFSSFKNTGGKLLPQAHMQYLRMLQAQENIVIIHEHFLRRKSQQYVDIEHSLSVSDQINNDNMERVIATCEDILELDPINLEALQTLISIYNNVVHTASMTSILKRLWDGIEYIGTESHILWTIFTKQLLRIFDQDYDVDEILQQINTYAQSYIEYTRIDKNIIDRLRDVNDSNSMIYEQALCMVIITSQSEHYWNVEDCNLIEESWPLQNRTAIKRVFEFVRQKSLT